MSERFLANSGARAASCLRLQGAIIRTNEGRCQDDAGGQFPTAGALSNAKRLSSRRIAAMPIRLLDLARSAFSVPGAPIIPTPYAPSPSGGWRIASCRLVLPRLAIPIILTFVCGTARTE